MSAYRKLENIFTKLNHINHISSFMTWDEAVMMPPGGGLARSGAMGTLKEIQHKMLTQPEIKDLIAQAKEEAPLSPWQQANLNWMEKTIDRETVLPLDLVKTLAEHSIQSEQAWRQYRQENNWEDYKPYLEKTFSLIKEVAMIRSETTGLSMYDVMLDEYSPDMTQAIIDPIFSRLKEELPPLIELIIEKQKSQPFLSPTGPFDIEQQKQLGTEVMAAIGFDFNHGRLDTSHHPFCGGVPEDVRVTTRYNIDDFSSAIMGICHETGHAIYEQQLPQEWRQQPVGAALGMSVHESQSLLMEMQACRSRGFMQFLSSKLQNYFGHDPALNADNLFKLYTKVERSLIRVDADEVTYPLHVILRYDIEKDLFEGSLQIAELPEIWNSKMVNYLGLSTIGNEKDGVMQDVHWPSGAFGYFPAYTLGRLMAAQFFTSMESKHPNLKAEISQGDFTNLNDWLSKNVHQLGSSVDYQALLKNATSETLNPNHFLRHIKERYQLSN